MAVTVEGAARWIGGLIVTPEVEIDLRELIDTGAAAVEDFAPSAPTTVKDHATRRIVVFLWHQRGAVERVTRVTPNILAASGAMALLAPWRASFAEICE